MYVYVCMCVSVCMYFGSSHFRRLRQAAEFVEHLSDTIEQRLCGVFRAISYLDVRRAEKESLRRKAVEAELSSAPAFSVTGVPSGGDATTLQLREEVIAAASRVTKSKMSAFQVQGLLRRLQRIDSAR